MPSGAKKRKAAKKKKQIETNNNHSTTHPLGGGERGSDGGSEVSSPASQEHHNQEEEVEKREDLSSVRSIASESKSIEGLDSYAKGTESIILIHNHIKPEVLNGGSSFKEGGSSSYSSSSSDDESRVVEKNIVVEEVETGVGEVDNSVIRAASVVDSKSEFAKDLVHSIESARFENYVPSSASSLSVGLAQLQKQDKLLLPFNAPKVDTSDDSDHVKDLEIPEFSDSQPLVASAPRTEQRTSWTSCCGILEVFKGNR